ncbi:MAG: TRAP transporter small permease subunit [Paracoccaceae bacterium]
MGLVETWGTNPIGWFFAHLIEAFYNFFYALFHPGQWLAWVPWFNQPLPSDEVKLSLLRFIYYGASAQLLFVFLVAFLLVTAVGLWRNDFMWACVRGLESFANRVGRTAAWAGLAMVLIQITIVFLQRVFAVSQITLGFGIAVTFDVSWWSESLKFYNAMIVALCVTYTFVQGGHVRVDLFYAKVSYRTKKLIDMLGCLFFMLPTALLIWVYGWFFLWRHMVVPNISASDTLDRVLKKAPAVRWNIETVGFSPNGFNAYVLFKVLILAFIVLVILQSVAFLYRSYLERKEGPEAEGRYLDKDPVDDSAGKLAASNH